MAITITIDDIKEYSGTTLSDTILNMYINSVTSKVGPCLERYDDDTANLIFLNLIAHLTTSSSQQKIQSESSPSGASISYATTVTKNGLGSTLFGEQVLMLDKYGCWQNLVAPSILICTVGN